MEDSLRNERVQAKRLLEGRGGDVLAVLELVLRAKRSDELARVGTFDAVDLQRALLTCSLCLPVMETLPYGSPAALVARSPVLNQRIPSWNDPIKERNVSKIEGLTFASQLNKFSPPRG